jgi:hypothetical protein
MHYHIIGNLHDPATNNSGNDNTSTNVDVFREKIGHIIGAGDHVGCKISSNLSYYPCESDEESTASTCGTVPMRDKIKRGPDIFAVNDFASARGDDAKHGYEEGDEGQESSLPVDSLLPPHVAREIWNVGAHRCPVAFSIILGPINSSGAYQPPQILEKLFNMSQDLVDPETLYS